MIKIQDKKDCCGCAACMQRCPKQCISLKEDEEGFLYPEVDNGTCMDCGLCDMVCPVINQNEPVIPLKVYAAKNNNEEQRLCSSSGGIFILLAEYIIKNGGVVFGAIYDDNWDVKHCYVETVSGLQLLMRSKYVQSRIGNTYKEAEDFLKQGRIVLFTGTSCQIAGLIKFLRRKYDNLLAVDVVCHGVPSPGIWRKYLKELKSERSEELGKNTVLFSSLKSMPKITGINFREKQNGGYTWQKYGFVVHAKSPLKGDQNTVLLSIKAQKNDYMRAFLNNLSLRSSCYACPAKNGKCGSDLTLADYWGIKTISPSFADDKGISMVMVNSDKAEKLIFEIKDMSLLPTEFELAVKNNTAYMYSALVPQKRNLFWELIDRGSSMHNTIRLIFSESYVQIIVSILKRIKSLPQKILRRMNFLLKQ